MTSESRRFIISHLSSRRAWLILITYLTLLTAVGVLLHLYVDREALRQMVNRSGSLGIWLFLLIEYLYIFFAPIYNTPIHLAAGYIFGGSLGWLLNFVATTAALFTIIALVKYFGRPLLARIVSESKLQKYDKLTQRIGPVALFIAYVLPLFPDDEITYMLAAGERVQFWRFILPVTLGNVTKAAVSFIGDEGSQGVPVALGSRILVLLVGLVLIGIQEYVVRRSKRKALEEKTK
jgi:uncharacterized membrane protein YdjX (TVP38/TMEM64 family)